MFKSKNSFSKRAQGTIEYLVIIAIVVVISLIVVGVVVSNTDSASSTSSKLSELELRGKLLGVGNASVKADGNYLLILLNNSGGGIQVNRVTVGSNAMDFSTSFWGGEKANFVISTSDVCTLGSKVVRSVSIDYTNLASNLTHTLSYGLVSFTCENYLAVSSSEGTPVEDTPTTLSVNLLAPSNSSTATSVPIDFNFSFSNSTTVSSCSLFIDSVDVNDITVGLVAGTTYSIPRTITEGTHTWDVNCVDATTSDLGGVRNISYSSNPVVSLSYPVNDANISSVPIDLNFVVTDDSSIPDCNLLVDSTVVDTLTSVAKDVNVRFSYSFAEGSYSWKVKCADAIGNTITSSIRTINYTIPISSGPTSLFFDWDTNFMGGIFNNTRTHGTGVPAYLGIKGVSDLNLIGFWRLNDNTNSTFVDYMGGDYNGTCVGDACPAKAPGVTDSNSMSFDGTDYITLGTNAALNPRDYLTLSAWIKTTVSGRTQIFAGKPSVSDGSKQWFFAMINASGYFAVQLDGGNYNDTSIATALAINDGVWHHVLATYDSAVATNQVKLYVDGQLLTQGGNGGAGNLLQLASTAEFRIGHAFDSPDYNVVGSIADVGLWDRVLALSEVSELAQAYPTYDSSTDINYISPVIDTGSASTTFSSLKFNLNNGEDRNGHSYGSQIDPTKELDLNNGLIGLWHLNDGNDTGVFDDSSVFDNNGTCTGSACPVKSAGLWDTNSMDFDGVDDYISLGNLSAVNNASQITISLWQKLSSFANVMTVCKSASSGFYAQWASANQLTFYWGAGATQIDTTGKMILNRWQHFVISSDGSDARIYVDGEYVGVRHASYAAGTDPIFIGAYGNATPAGYWTDGRIEEVGIWNRAFDANEVMELFNIGAGKLGVQYRSCAQSDCSDGSWSASTYNANTDISLSGVTANRYFQFLVKPGYYDFFEPIAAVTANCSGTSNKYCMDYGMGGGSPYDSTGCAQYNSHNGDCAANSTGYGCIGMANIDCMALNQTDCGNTYNMCSWYDACYSNGGPYADCFYSSIASEGVCTSYGCSWTLQGSCDSTGQSDNGMIRCSNQADITSCGGTQNCTWNAEVAAQDRFLNKISARPKLQDLNITYE